MLRTWLPVSRTITRARRWPAFAVLVFLAPPVAAFDYSAELGDIRDRLEIAGKVYALEQAKTDPADIADEGFVLRSPHFIFGLPRLTDDRYDTESGAPGISLLVREGFVIAHFDEMMTPIWVAQRWTADEDEDQDAIESLDRDWREDPDLPPTLHIGTSYAGNTTGLDRGHMAKHSMNRAWGYDGSIQGCLMSNAVPQHKSINRGGAWRQLEDEIEEIFNNGVFEGEAVWTISGAIYRDADNPPGELPAQDFDKVGRITTGFGVPFATFKIVAWFEPNGFFQARGYIFEQPYTVDARGNLIFQLPDPSRPMAEFIEPIDEIEARIGVDFFPQLRDPIENKIERTDYSHPWVEF